MPTSSSARTASGRVTLPGLSFEAFVAPTDRIALQNLQKLPLLPMLMRKFNEVSLDRLSYVQNTAESVRCGPKQFQTIFDMMREACEILDVPPPELYVRYSPHYNAYTAGMSRTFIVIQSALLNDFSDEELRFVIGHEVGHIKCEHLLYQSLSSLLFPLLELVGSATLGAGQLAGRGLVSAFLEWVRQAEFSCDRAGLLVGQNPQAALSATMKTGCGATRFDHEMNPDAFLEQARSYSEGNRGLDGAARALDFVLFNWQLTHPQVVFRAKALDEWQASGAYERILRGDYPRQNAPGAVGPQIQCAQCRKFASARLNLCPSCGHDLRADPFKTTQTKPSPRPEAAPLALPAVALPAVAPPGSCARCGDALIPGLNCLSCGYPAS